MNWPACWTSAGIIACTLLIAICLVAQAPLNGLGLIIILGVSLGLGLLIGACLRPDPYRLRRW